MCEKNLGENPEGVKNCAGGCADCVREIQVETGAEIGEIFGEDDFLRKRGGGNPAQPPKKSGGGRGVPDRKI